MDGKEDGRKPPNLSTSFPFKSYKQVSIPPECTFSPENLGASMCVFGSDLLFDEKVIDEVGISYFFSFLLLSSFKSTIM